MTSLQPNLRSHKSRKPEHFKIYITAKYTWRLIKIGKQYIKTHNWEHPLKNHTSCIAIRKSTIKGTPRSILDITQHNQTHIFLTETNDSRNLATYHYFLFKGLLHTVALTNKNMHLITIAATREHWPVSYNIIEPNQRCIA